MWIQERAFREQPDVHFRHELMYQAQGASYLTWSTGANYNRLNQGHVRIPVVKSREVDENGDGLRDRLELELSLPLMDNESVTRFSLVLGLDYHLREFVDLRMQGIVYIDYTGSPNGARLSVDGPLHFRQRDALPHDGSRSIYDVRMRRRHTAGTRKSPLKHALFSQTPVIDYASTRASAYDLTAVFSAYQSRNGTHLLPACCCL